MAKDLKFIVKSVASNDFITGVVLFLLLALVGKYKIGLILFLGLIISMLNFIISAKITVIYYRNYITHLIFFHPDYITKYFRKTGRKD